MKYATTTADSVVIKLRSALFEVLDVTRQRTSKITYK